MACIYQSSKYYAKAKAEASSVADPIGYKFLLQVKKAPTAKKGGQKVFKYISDKPQTKQLSSRAPPFRQVERWLKLTQSSQRKNYNLNGQNLEFINKNLTETTVQNLKSSFFPTWKDLQLLNFLQVLSAMQILKDNAFSIRDYALSTYIACYYGQNAYFYNYIQNAIRQQFIEYNNEILIYCPQLSRPQLRKIDYQQKDQVQNYIYEILQIGREKDKLFGGVHLYVSDILPEKKSSCAVIKEEEQWWSFVQFQVAVATGVLGEGQHAIIKTGGTFTSKSIEYIFLLKLAFQKVYFHKSNMGNPFTSHKYLVCEYFCKESGRAVSQHLLNNYDQILLGKDGVNMVDHKAIYLNDFHTNVNDYNNLSSIIKLAKEVFKEYTENCNISFYPPKQTFTRKIEELKLATHAQALQKIEDLIPVLQKKEQKKQEAIQKVAVVIDFEAMGEYCRPAPRQNQPELFDLSQNPNEENPYLNSYMERANKVSKHVKEQNIKKNKLKKEQMEGQH